MTRSSKSRVSKHFPHIDATNQVNIPKCACGWVGNVFVKGRLGEQLAREQAKAHISSASFVKVSRMVAKPVFSYEVSA